MIKVILYTFKYSRITAFVRYKMVDRKVTVLSFRVMSEVMIMGSQNIVSEADIDYFCLEAVTFKH